MSSNSLSGSPTKAEHINDVKSNSTESFSNPDLEKVALDNYAKQPIRLTEEEKIEQVNVLAQELGINQTRLQWKIDLGVVPGVMLLYFLAFLDRVNISNAKVYGMSKDLGLVGNQFNTALSVFFVPYIVFELFSNYFIKIVKPSLWLTGCIVIFGGVTVGMGFVDNFGGLVACRFLLGLFECSTFPGIFYILSTYYTKQESQRRFSFFFSSTCLAGAAGGAIAFRIDDLDGKHGIASWAWIFIIEGAATIGLGIFVLSWLIPDFPETARFLNDNERRFILRKLEIHSVDSGFEHKHTLKESCKIIGKDPIFIFSALSYFGIIIPAYGYAYFAPTIITQMGYTSVSANQHSVYPWLCAFGFSNVTAFFSDRYRIRTPIALGSCVMAIIGLALILGLHNNPQGRYAGCFLAATGLYSAMPLLICLTSLNFGGHLRKSTGTAFQIGFGNIGGIISTFIFLSADAPRFTKGLSISLAFTVFSMFFMCVMVWDYRKKNIKKETPEYREKFFSQSEREIVLQGDLHPNFKYYY